MFTASRPASASRLSHIQRIEAFTMNVELLLKNGEQDGENIRALARTAEIRERRITALEGGER